MLRNGSILHALLPFLTAVLVSAFPPGFAGEGDPGGPRLPELLEDYRTAVPASTGIALENRTAGSGHLQLRFERGALFPLRTRSGATLGFFFEGKGRFTYRSEEPADQEVLFFKTARLAPGIASRFGEVGDSFDRLLLMFAAPAFEELLQGGEGTPSAPPLLQRRTRARFEKIEKRFQEGGTGFDHLAAEARSGGGAGQLIRGWMEGPRRSVVYTLDTLRQGQESLSLLRRSPFSGRFGLEPLSQQPIPGERAPRFAPLSLRDIRVEVDARGRPGGSVGSELSLEATRDDVRMASFHLINHRRPFSEPWSSPRESLRVLRVTDGKGRELLFSHRYHELLVELAEPLSWGSTLRLKVETAGEIFGEGEKGGQQDTFSLAGIPWYPSPTGWSPDGFTFTLRVRTRKPARSAATGRVVRFREEGDGFDLVTEGVVPVRRLAVVAGDLSLWEEKSEGPPVRFYARDAGPGETPFLAARFLKFFQDLLGPYPYGDLQVVEAPVYGFGAALPGMVLVPGSRFKPREDYYARYFNRGLSWRLAHEIARQWFGQKVYPASPRDSWLADSVAEYLSNVAVSDTAPPEQRKALFHQGLEEWGWEARGCRNSGSLAAAGLLYGDLAGAERFCLLFNRGPRVLQMLRLVMGDEKFFLLLRRALSESRLDLLSAPALRKIAEEETGADLGWFFEDWVQRGGIPEIQLTWDLEPSGETGWALSGRALQSPGPGFRRLPIPLALDYPDGRRETLLVFQDTPVTPFRFDLAERPRRITPDPGHDTLAYYLLSPP